MNKINNKRNSLGFATPCTLLNVVLGGMVVLGSCLGVSSMHKVAVMASYPSLNQQGQQASSVIAQDLRRASSLDSVSSDRVVLRANNAGTISTISYTYDAQARTLTRSDAAGSQILLKNVDALSFSLFQRPAADAAYGTFLPATAANAKMVGCRWSCSRRIGTAKLDTETVELAPVVLRNRC